MIAEDGLPSKKTAQKACHGAPVTSDTLFQAASVSKPVAALAALRLVESGKLSLDDDVNQYLKSWKVQENDFTKNEKVTLRGLLTHTAGMTVRGFPGYAPGESIPTTVQILNGDAPANTPPLWIQIHDGNGATRAAAMLSLSCCWKTSPACRLRNWRSNGF